ncbi:MAG: hypothetical protein R3C19_02315 [Planctomycetaceae bacterium]
MPSITAIPNKHLHHRQVKSQKLAYSSVVKAITKHNKYPGYTQLIAAAGSISNMAKAISAAAAAVRGIPFVGAVVAAVLQAIGAVFKLVGNTFVAAAGVLVLIVNELT